MPGISKVGGRTYSSVASGNNYTLTNLGIPLSEGAASNYSSGDSQVPIFYDAYLDLSDTTTTCFMCSGGGYEDFAYDRHIASARERKNLPNTRRMSRRVSPAGKPKKPNSVYSYRSPFNPHRAMIYPQ